MYSNSLRGDGSNIKPSDQKPSGNYPNSIYPDESFIIGYEINVVLGFKYTASILSLLGSLFIIICYLYLTYLVVIKPKFQKKKNESNENQNNKNYEHQNSENNENNNNNYNNPNNERNNQNDYKKLKLFYGHDLIFLLAISDFVLSISGFFKMKGFDSGKIDSACVAQGFIMNLAEMTSICWTTIIAYSIYLSTKTTGISLIPKFYLYFFFFSYGIPIIFSIVPLFLNAYGPAGAWCWLYTKDLKNDFAWTWSLIIYLFNWLNIIFNIYAVSKSIRYFKIRIFEIKEDNLEEANFLKNFCIVLKFFPIILVICWLPPTINRIYLFISKTENTFLYSMHAFFTNLTGFLNCLVYSYYYKNLISLWCCGRKNYGNNGNGNPDSPNHIEMEKIRNENNNIENKNNEIDYEKNPENTDYPSINEKNVVKSNINDY